MTSLPSASPTVRRDRRQNALSSWPAGLEHFRDVIEISALLIVDVVGDGVKNPLRLNSVGVSDGRVI